MNHRIDSDEHSSAVRASEVGAMNRETPGFGYSFRKWRRVNPDNFPIRTIGQPGHDPTTESAGYTGYGNCWHRGPPFLLFGDER